MGMTTAEYFIRRVEIAGGCHSVVATSNGYLLSVLLTGDSFDTTIIVTKDQFLISLPIGNKIHCSFFPKEEQELLQSYFSLWTNGYDWFN